MLLHRRKSWGGAGEQSTNRFLASNTDDVREPEMKASKSTSTGSLARAQTDKSALSFEIKEQLLVDGCCSRGPSPPSCLLLLHHVTSQVVPNGAGVQLGDDNCVGFTARNKGRNPAHMPLLNFTVEDRKNAEGRK
ncbi:hypothetical protein C0Q70_12931 [Pomacea canaliculata]|uniref:Uncharacterized protein n=1 Tax=Pomacea canaliculata TaxID=400727 RepID=A0A2T7P2V7_POMCA|nr:hypothetical protein C0Q70_12931 [Pomacea canaliculata]